jgi:hypothetical protein
MEPLSDTIATLGCCKKVMHIECLIKCMKQRLACPMCRTHHGSLSLVRDVESQVLVPVPVPQKNKNVFLSVLTATILMTLVITSTEFTR